MTTEWKVILVCDEDRMKVNSSVHWRQNES